MSWRVLVAVVATMILIVAIVTAVVRAQIRSQTVDTTVDAAAILSSVINDRSLTLTDVVRGMNPVSGSALITDVISLKRRGEVIRLAMWSLSTGWLLYADADASETPTPTAEVRTQARAGKPFLAPGNGSRAQSDNLVVYYPYDANGDGTVDAVAEVVLPREQFEGSVARSTRLLYAGGLLVLLLAVAGILQVRRHQLRKDHAAVHDALTGLGNRLLLRRAAPPVLAGATVESPAALLLIDLDSFKSVNDTLGHHAGDELLVAVAGLIRQASGPSGVPVRLGGDEFAVLLPPVSDRGRAREVARRIRDSVRQPVTVGSNEVEVDASVGLAWAPADGAELSDLLRSADMAMYWAKRGGNGVAEYVHAAQTVVPRSAATTVAELPRALGEHEIELFYQPVHGHDAAVASVEALPRWHHPERGLLEARSFIPAVANTSFMSAFTEWVLNEAARQCAKWRAGRIDVVVSVNISARTLFSEALEALLRGAAQGFGLPPSALELEVAETILVREPARAMSAMQRLHGADVRLCIDNFGSAYGALSAIADSPIDRLKIDGRFSRGVVDSARARMLVRGWARIAHELDLIVVAEGVETLAAVQRLIDLGCDGVQGYAVCPPMPANDLTDWFATLDGTTHMNSRQAANGESG